jgi:hypothetical protein
MLNVKHGFQYIPINHYPSKSITRTIHQTWAKTAKTSTSETTNLSTIHRPTSPPFTHHSPIIHQPFTNHLWWIANCFLHHIFSDLSGCHWACHPCDPSGMIRSKQVGVQQTRGGGDPIRQRLHGGKTRAPYAFYVFAPHMLLELWVGSDYKFSESVIRARTWSGWLPSSLRKCYCIWIYNIWCELIVSNLCIVCFGADQENPFLFRAPWHPSA